MRIARIGNLYQPIPATEYGGTQRSMAQMTAFQAAVCAHDITLYAPSESGIIDFTSSIARKLGLATTVDDKRTAISITNADGRVGRVQLKSLGMASTGYEDPQENEKHNRLFAELLRDERANPFHVIHLHARRYMATDIPAAGLANKTLVHQHNAVLEKSYAQAPYPLICISNGQAELMRKKYKAKVYDVVHHGLDSYTHAPSTQHAGYAAWIGRFLTNKGADRAIKIASEAGLPLVMAGMVYERDADSQRHFDHDIRPHIDVHDPKFLTRVAKMPASEVRHEIAAIQSSTGKKSPVIFVGPADDGQKQTLYGNAVATLFPISWAEPFGRVMIESMACATPVVAYKSIGKIDCGSVAEVIDQGVTGFAVAASDEADGVRKAAKALAQAAQIDRPTVRRVFDEKWTSERVARQLDDIYLRFLRDQKPRAAPSVALHHKPT